jgi:hypothetical protein
VHGVKLTIKDLCAYAPHERDMLNLGATWEYKP